MSVLILRGKLPPLCTPQWVYDLTVESYSAGEGYGSPQGIDSTTGSSVGYGYRLDTAGGSGTGCVTSQDHNSTFNWLLSVLK